MFKPTTVLLGACLLPCLLTNSTHADAGAASAPASFDDATATARNLLDVHRTARLLALSDSNDAEPGLPLSATASNPGDLVYSDFDFGALYVTGAKVSNVYDAGDSGYRTLSVKIYSTRDSGNLINRIGIVDITAGYINTPTRPQFIGVLSRRTNYFRMTEGGREYALKLSSNGDILLTRINSKWGQGGALSTSLRELMTERNKQIMQGPQVLIDGAAFYVLGQGGGNGSFLFFRKDAVDRDPSGAAHPELMGDVAQVLGDGSTARISGYPRLGSLINGDAFHLEYGNDGLWHVRPGDGNTGN